ncbi:hypothetical protein [Coxiella burnetii]|uniref:hypothetical protein n=1 Tax=Coxiella burnetii TaxID=777 RepID=UPI000BFDA9F8|nr:hypothetical protein [Coxiella burnetii]PHH57655.1 hypothetical protein CRH12_04200 [Coxiella burnetii]
MSRTPNRNNPSSFFPSAEKKNRRLRSSSVRVMPAPAASQSASSKKRKRGTIDFEQLYDHFNKLKKTYYSKFGMDFNPQIKRTEAAEGPFDVFISDLNINLSEKDTFSFFDAAFRFYFETKLPHRTSTIIFTDCLIFLKALSLFNCNLTINDFKDILKGINSKRRDEDTEGKHLKKKMEELTPLTHLFKFLGGVRRMNLTSTVLEGLGDELKLILASDDLKSLIPNWINTQEKEILPYLPKRRSQNGSEALRFWHSLSEEKLSEHSPVLPTIDVRCD